MTNRETLDRLIVIAGRTNGGGRGDEVLSCDLLHQEALYQLQEDLADLMANLANSIGPQGVSALRKAFPRVFDVTPTIKQRG